MTEKKKGGFWKFLKEVVMTAIPYIIQKIKISKRR
jgi:hypothetical protein